MWFVSKIGKMIQYTDYILRPCGQITFYLTAANVNKIKKNIFKS